MCYVPCRRYERGLIILEDIARAETPFYLADKNEVMSPDHARKEFTYDVGNEWEGRGHVMT